MVHICEVLLAKHCNNKYSKPTVVVVVVAAAGGGGTRITPYKPKSSVNERDSNVKLWFSLYTY